MRKKLSVHKFLDVFSITIFCLLFQQQIPNILLKIRVEDGTGPQFRYKKMNCRKHHYDSDKVSNTTKATYIITVKIYQQLAHTLTVNHKKLYYPHYMPTALW
jgi:hypothetical protein